MQCKKGKFLLALCLLQVLGSEIFVWAQDATTTTVISTEKTTVSRNTAESTVATDSGEQLITTTFLPESCGEDCNEPIASDCQCNCTAASLRKLCDQLSTANGSGEETTQPTVETTTKNNSPSEESTTSTAANVEETTTNLPNANDEASTTTENIETIEQTTLPAVNCIEIGNLPYPGDCRRYYNCNQTTDGFTLQLTEQLCPTGLAFNTEFSSCMRDLSPCSREHVGFNCTQAGSFPDPNNDTNLYYRCVPHLNGEDGAYHKYLVRCGAGRIYMAELGKCFVDFNAAGNYPSFGFNSNEPNDEQLVKAEIKQWKVQEKIKLKEEKNKLKYEQKLQKELAKQQAKEAKEKAKAEKKQKKQPKNFDFDDDDDD